MDYTDTWGIYPCFQGTNDEMVDAGSREEFFKLQPYGKVFQCISMCEDMITLKYGEKIFRVKSELYRTVREPLYKVGDRVEIISKSLAGRIIDINWHVKENSPFYLLKIEGKKSGKRYWECDLKKMD